MVGAIEEDHLIIRVAKIVCSNFRAYLGGKFVVSPKVVILHFGNGNRLIEIIRLQSPFEGDQQQGHCGDALLAVDHQPARNGGINIGFRNVNGGADKVAVQLRALADANDVVLQLLAMTFFPTVGALKNRDDELLRTFEQLGELYILRFHKYLLLTCHRQLQTFLDHREGHNVENGARVDILRIAELFV